MQNVETCPQEEALKAVLLNLGYKEEELQDLHAVKGVTWRLFRMVWGAHSWEDMIETESFRQNKIACHVYYCIYVRHR